MNYSEYPDVGIDRKIKLMQDALHKFLAWQSVNFYGRASKVFLADGKQKEALIYQTNSEGTDVYLNDQRAPGGSVFFIDDDEHQQKAPGVMSAKVRIVFMLDLKNLFGQTEYRPDAEVQQRAMKVVSDLKAMNDIGILKSVDKVLKDVKNDHLRQYDKQPLHIFAITGTIKYYNNNCKN